MKSALIAVLLFAISAHATTVDNDDSCDISVLPAATLLLPYFEVDLDRHDSATTLFTITNVTNVDRIARVTLWTDRAYPLLTFNVALTGYDMQSIDLFDVIARGQIAAGSTGRGRYSDENAELDLSGCAAAPLDAAALAHLRSELTPGGVQTNAIGYATVDVVGNCSSRTPADESYWTEDLRYDNVLIGEYEQRNHNASAHGAPLVHIRAIPEGGTPASRSELGGFDAGFPRTFYSRYQPASVPRLDGRQPLPSTFAVRWSENTSLKIWRETTAGAQSRVTELVQFDEEENAVSGKRVSLPATSRTSLNLAATPGWVYLNLDDVRGDAYASQNWVIASTGGIDSEAIALGNGCSPAAPTSTFTASSGPPIAPAPDENALGVRATTNNDDSCDIALLPAATLLLPYFEVDLDANTETTLFTVTNVAPKPQFAHITLWTDFGYPVVDFTIALNPYDMQSVDLSDVLKRGIIPTCSLSAPLSPEILVAIRQAFTLGRVRGAGPLLNGCNTVGNVHDNAVGYATIDVVRTCTANGPASPAYWTRDIAFDNVLTGDSQQVNTRLGQAQGGPLVHVRAVPELRGARTFYSSFQSPHTPPLDARQPLPSRFAARWRQGGPEQFVTSYKIWRDRTKPPGTCHDYVDGGYLNLGEAVRFDEAENAFADAVPNGHVTPLTTDNALPLTSLTAITDHQQFPPVTNGAVSGWTYLNLDDICNPFCLVPESPHADQAWVVTSTRSLSGFASDVDAAALGNGCSPGAAASEIRAGRAVIGPARNKP